MCKENVLSFVVFIVLTIQIGEAFYFPDEAHLSLSDVLNQNCGSTAYDDRDRPPEGRLQESPWLALLFYPDEPVHFCHATLITTKHILTTAACAVNIFKNETTIILGEYELYKDQDCVGIKCSDPVQRRLAHKVILHEHYDADTFKNDLAIIVLDQDVLFTDSIKPICLPLIEFEIGTVNQPNVYNTLWTTTPRPQQFWMRYIGRDGCQKLLMDRITLNAGQICASSYNNRLIDMTGGAGSALEVEYHNRIYQVAMLSVGILNSDAGTPFIYVDVQKYVKWIHDSVKKSR